MSFHAKTKPVSTVRRDSSDGSTPPMASVGAAKALPEQQVGAQPAVAVDNSRPVAAQASDNKSDGDAAETATR